MDYKEVLESKYNRSAWQNFLHDIFGKRITLREPIAIDVKHEIAKKAFYLGKITLADNQLIAIYEVELNNNVNIERNKVSLRNLLVSQWRDSGFAGAFMLCYSSGESVLRFSYVSENYRFDENHQYKKFSTDTKRYTYVLGENRPCRTAIERFTQLRDSNQTLDDVTKAFSVEVLTKQFYNELFDWYSWAVSDESGVYFPNNVNIEEDDRENIETKIIRLITRIMFVWFIKQKDLVPNKLFDKDFLQGILKDFNSLDTHSGNYYNAILQNLFFATLNRAIIDDEGNKRRFAYLKGQRDIKNLYRYSEMFKISEQEVIDMFASVPFLNGGLFECLDKTKKIDGVEVAYNYDGFSRNDKKFANGRYRNRAFIPNILFFEPNKGLFSILSRYNFTIEENTPDDQQVALDPELLGKVFENLLGAYNPETRETARNQSGSFYTPREIVNYMVDESLINYLGDNDIVRSIFDDNFEYQEKDKKIYTEITEKLKEIKILDPACGSGAFPMGMLNRIVDILKKLNVSENVYDLKLHVIENCIYGSDKQSIAAQITKLRFFISLICDCDRDESKPNFGIPTLPNLETKFVAADSLIGIKKVPQHDLFEDPRIEETKNKLKEVRHEHFNAKTASRKYRLRKQDEQLRIQLADLLKGSEIQPADAIQLAKWNPYDQNEVSPFFDPEWMFGIKEGFDIVVGNPPYVQLQNNGGALAKKYEGQGYKTFARTGDEYCLFYERGWQLLKEGGHLCYITSNKWMRAGYGEKTRDFFAKNTNPILLVDFAGVKIFESATVDTNILLFAKCENKKHTICAVTNKENKDSVKKLSIFVRQQHTINAFEGSGSWAILSPIERSIKQKIEAVGTPLKDWNINIYRGVLTGCNDAFIISTEKREEILSNCHDEAERKRTEELIRPILRGRDIKRYGYNWANLYLIATFPSRHYNIDDYPSVKNYLLSYAKDNLLSNGLGWIVDKYLADFCKQKLSQTGKAVSINGQNIIIGQKVEKARKKTSNKWFETQDSISYWEDFDKPKMVYMEIQTDNPKEGYPFPCFSYDNSRKIVLNTGYVLSSKKIDVKYILGILNSSLGKFLVKLYVTQLQERQFRMLAQYVNKMPIPIPTSKQEKNIAESVNKILKHHLKEDEETINLLVFDIFGLSQEEQNYINSIQDI